MSELSKQLTTSDCRSKLAVPAEFHDLINGRRGGAELSVRDAETNEIYKFVLAVRPEGKYQKPVFQSAAWLDFVRRRRLQAGNLIFFSKDEMNAGGFKIRPSSAFQVTEPLSKRLTTTDCNSAFSVPPDFHALISGPCGAELSVRDFETNQKHKFVLEFQREGNYTKPVFQAEAWLDFVNTKGLEAGDEIYFFTDKMNAGGFKIQPLFDCLGRSDRAAAPTTHVS